MHLEDVMESGVISVKVKNLVVEVSCTVSIFFI
jgi:hypothetical protein